MKTRKVAGSLLLLTFGILFAFGNGFAESDKIPVTASSEEALEHYLKGRDLAEKLRFQESEAFFDKAITADPEFAMAYLNVALARPTATALFSDLEKAVALSKKVSEGEKAWILGVQAGINGEPMKQREYWKQMVELHPNDERAQNLLGNHYFGLQEYEEAIKYYNKAIAINPDFSQPYNQHGYANRFLGKYEDAEKSFQKYIELIPDDPNPYDSYAELLMKMGKFEQSIEKYREALKINDNFVASHIGIATNFNYLEQHEKAREQLDVLLNTAKNDGQKRAACFAMAVSYTDEGDMEGAMKCVEDQYKIAEATDDKQSMAGDMVLKGNILYEMGKYDEALASYEKGLDYTLKANVTKGVKVNAKRFSKYNKARVAIRQGNLDIARTLAAEFHKEADAAENTFQIWLAHELNGLIAFKEGNFDVALNELWQANRQNPYNYYRMAVVCNEKGDVAKAKKMCEKAANYNALNNMNQSFIRNKAKKLMSSL
jgi:tetratricopeptide (TPR) repeat protein